VVLGNQPEPHKPDVAAAEPSIGEAASAPQADEDEPGGTPAAPGPTALASLRESTATRLPAAGSPPRVLAPGAAGKATPANPVGVLLATRTPAGELPPATANAAASVHPAPALGAAASASGHAPGALSGVGAGSGEAAAGGGPAGTAAAAHPVAATAAGASPAAAGNAADTSLNPAGGSPAGSAPADPKKEPGREASTMGHLLVENPSF